MQGAGGYWKLWIGCRLGNFKEFLNGTILWNILRGWANVSATATVARANKPSRNSGGEKKSFILPEQRDGWGASCVHSEPRLKGQQLPGGSCSSTVRVQEHTQLHEHFSDPCLHHECWHRWDEQDGQSYGSIQRAAEAALGAPNVAKRCPIEQGRLERLLHPILRSGHEGLNISG